MRWTYEKRIRSSCRCVIGEDSEREAGRIKRTEVKAGFNPDQYPHIAENYESRLRPQVLQVLEVPFILHETIGDIEIDDSRILMIIGLLNDVERDYDKDRLKLWYQSLTVSQCARTGKQEWLLLCLKSLPLRYIRSLRHLLILARALSLMLAVAIEVWAIRGCSSV